MMSRVPHLSTLATIVITAFVTVAATRLVPEANAQGPGATCEMMDWKVLRQKQSMADFQALVGKHGGAANTYILPIASQGTTTGFMLCSHD